MKKIMAKNIHDLKFHWTTKISNEDQQQLPQPSNSNSNTTQSQKVDANEGKKNEKAKKEMQEKHHVHTPGASSNVTRKKQQTVAVSRLRSVVLAAISRHRANFQQGLGHRVMGTLFGHRKGHVHFAIQKEPGSEPAFLIELATPITGLVREMATGLVRIALECNKEEKKQQQQQPRLLEEPVWRTFCNGKKCGFATRRDCGPKDWSILKALEPISTGAGVLPGKSGGGGDGSETEEEIMYMRAKFERVVGSRDSEAFYMMNPDSNGAPELSIYLLRL